jgi:hypothetical protein
VIWFHRIAAVIIGLCVAVVFCGLALAAIFHEFGDRVAFLFFPVTMIAAAGFGLVFGVLSGLFYYWYFRSSKPTSRA